MGAAKALVSLNLCKGFGESEPLLLADIINTEMPHTCQYVVLVCSFHSVDSFKSSRFSSS